MFVPVQVASNKASEPTAASSKLAKKASLLIDYRTGLDSFEYSTSISLGLVKPKTAILCKIGCSSLCDSRMKQIGVSMGRA